MSSVAAASVAAPGPAPAASLAGLDPSAVIGLVSMQISEGQVSQAKNRAQSLSTKRETALRNARHALQEAEKKKNDGGFFSSLVSTFKTIAKVAAIAASVAAIATGAGAGIGTVALIGICASTAGMTMQLTGLDVNLGKVSLFGVKIDVSLGEVLTLAGAAASAGADVAAAASKGAEVSGVAQQATTMDKVLTATKFVADGTQVASLGVAAYYTVRAGDAKADAVDLDADAKADQADADQAKSDFEDQVDAVRGAMDTRSRAADALGQILNERQQDIQTLTEGVRA
jgi:hypothetical protein